MAEAVIIIIVAGFILHAVVRMNFDPDLLECLILQLVGCSQPFKGQVAWNFLIINVIIQALKELTPFLNVAILRKGFLQRRGNFFPIKKILKAFAVAVDAV